MSLSIHETFRVGASAERVFAFLTNPAEVVTCLPGAELTETIDERTYGGRVKVKVGPITAAYAGRATLVDVDAAEGRVRIVGEGKESGGPGSARMTLDGVVRALPEGGSEVHIDAAIDIVGRVMQFGRGLIESVSKQLFRQFVEAAQARLAADSLEGAGPRGEAPTPAVDGGETGVAARAVAGGGDEESGGDATAAAGAAAAPNEPGIVPGPAAAPPLAAARAAGAAPPARAPSARGPAASDPAAAGRELHALPLLWKVFVSWLRGRFGRAR